MAKTPIDDLKQFGQHDDLTRQLRRAQQDIARLNTSNHDLTHENIRLHERLEVLEHLDGQSNQVPGWITRLPGKGKLHHAMPTLLLSDMHLDEVVRPEEVQFVNAYNREIAVQRLNRTFENIVTLTRSYFSGLTYDGFVLLLGGDNFSGGIHEELLETNEDTLYGSLDFWSDQLTGFILGLVKEFGKVHAVGVVGNHSRRTRLPRAKFRAKDNLDWLLYRMLAKATSPKVTWQIPEAADADVKIFQTSFLLTHGDQFKGGSGIAGMLGPLTLGKHRVAEQQMALHKNMDWLVVGHWHTYLHGAGLIVNGALKGYDEYSLTKKFRPEPPVQAMFLVTPEHGACFPAPVFCMDRKAEGW